MSAPELEGKIRVSYALILGIVASAFTIGGVVTKITSQAEEIQEVRRYVEQEVGGLRSDWERRYKDNVNPRLENLENGED